MRRRQQSSDTMKLSRRSTDSDVKPLAEIKKDLKRFHQCRQTIILVYVLHWSLTIVILVWGMMQNGGDRKYVPVDPSGLESLITNEFNEVVYDISCQKAYVNVHTSSIEDQLAMVCCTKEGTMSMSVMPEALEQYQSDLCNPRLPYFNTRKQPLPFQKRLSRFPEAWILPLLPILVRIIFQLISSIWILIGQLVEKPTVVKSPSLNSKSSSLFAEKIALVTSIESSDSTTSKVSNQLRSTVQRLLFYFIILNLRGWGLYIGANAIEDYCIVPWLTGNKVISPLRTNSISDVEHNIKSSSHECWYKDVLKAHHRNEMESDYYSDCYGRPFDFSDHIVLFLAHYLPIFVMETMICFMFPFWISIRSQSSLKWCISGTFVILHLVLFLYIHVIVLHATYQTTAYFHTNAEIIVGYLLSLFIQVPVVYLLCSTKWKVLRQFIGLPVEQVIPGKSV